MKTPKAKAPARITVAALLAWWPTDPPTTQWEGMAHSPLLPTFPRRDHRVEKAKPLVRFPS